MTAVCAMRALLMQKGSTQVNGVRFLLDGKENRIGEKYEKHYFDG